MPVAGSSDGGGLLMLLIWSVAQSFGSLFLFAPTRGTVPRSLANMRRVYETRIHDYYKAVPYWGV